MVKIDHSKFGHSFGYFFYETHFHGLALKNFCLGHVHEKCPKSITRHDDAHGVLKGNFIFACGSPKSENSTVSQDHYLLLQVP